VRTLRDFPLVPTIGAMSVVADFPPVARFGWADEAHRAVTG
jgi:hypothetical protein